MKKFIILASLLLVASLGFISPNGSPKGGYKVGDIASDFHLKNTDGKMVSLADFNSAKGFIVVFTCNHCPFSKMYEQRILDLNKEFSGAGYPVVAINPTDPEAYPADTYSKMVDLAQSHHYSFPYLNDVDQRITRIYGATNTPHVFVLNKEDRNLVVRYIGAIDDNAEDASQAKVHYVADAVHALLAGKPVAVSSTKAIGCGIKMKNS